MGEVAFRIRATRRKLSRPIIEPPATRGVDKGQKWHWDKELKSYVLLGRLLTREEFTAAMTDGVRLQTWNNTICDIGAPHRWQLWTVEVVDVEKAERVAKAKAGADARAVAKEVEVEPGKSRLVAQVRAKMAAEKEVEA